MLVHVEDVFMSGRLETLKKNKQNIKKKFNISESGKVNKFLGVYYEWGHDAKGMYAKTTTDKDVKDLIEVYKKYTGSDLKVQKIPRAPDMTRSKSDLQEPDNINKYISFVGQLMWYTTKVGPDVANAARELAVHMSHSGTDH